MDKELFCSFSHTKDVGAGVRKYIAGGGVENGANGHLVEQVAEAVHVQGKHRGTGSLGIKINSLKLCVYTLIINVKILVLHDVFVYPVFCELIGKRQRSEERL